MESNMTNNNVGMLGLGIMGSAMSVNLIAAGFKVSGFDISPQRMEAFAKAGGTPARSPREVARQADVVISVLPSVAALDRCVSAADGILASGRSDLVLVEASTFPIEDKLRIRDLCGSGIAMLDCPLSGTGAWPK